MLATTFDSYHEIVKARRRRIKYLANRPLDLSSQSAIWDTATRYRNSSGYASLKVYDPFLHKYSCRLEHILIWERVHGRPVPRNCYIHHRDLDPANNRAENLMCVPVALHLELHARIRCAQRDLSRLAFEVERQRITEEYELKSKDLMDLWDLLENATG